MNDEPFTLQDAVDELGRSLERMQRKREQLLGQVKMVEEEIVETNRMLDTMGRWIRDGGGQVRTEWAGRTGEG